MIKKDKTVSSKPETPKRAEHFYTNDTKIITKENLGVLTQWSTGQMNPVCFSKRLRHQRKSPFSARLYL